MRSVNPYLNFDGNTEEAFNFYKSVFGGEFVGGIRRYRDFGENVMGVPEEDLDKVAHIALPLGPANMLMATDTLAAFPREHVAGNNFYITLEPESLDEAERLFEALSDGGRVEMEPQRTAWAELYGMCADRFGIQWMLSYAGDVTLGAGS